MARRECSILALVLFAGAASLVACCRPLAVCTDGARGAGAPTRPEVAVQTGHLFGIDALAVSENGHLLASGDSTGVVALWDLRTRRQIRSFQGAQKNILALAFSAADRTLAAQGDGGVVVYDLHTGEVRKRWNGAAFPSLGFSPDGRTLAAAVSPFGTSLLSLRDGGQGASISLSRAIFHPSRPWVIGRSGADLVLWDLEQGKEVRRMKGHEAAVRELAVSSDGHHAATASFDGTVRLWNLDEGREIRRYKVGTACSVAFSPDGRHLAATTGGTSQSAAMLWDVATGSEVAKLLRGYSGDRIRFVTNTLVALAKHKSIHLYDVPSQRRIATLSGFIGYTQSSVAFGPDSRILYSTSGSEQQAWRLDRVRLARRMMGGHMMTLVPGSHFSASSVASGKPEVETWDLENATKIRTLTTGIRWIRSLSTDQAGRVAVAGLTGWAKGETVGGAVELYERDTLLWKVPSGRLGALGADLSRDGRVLAVVDDDGGESALSIWDTQERKRLHRRAGEPLLLRFPYSSRAIRVDPKGRWVALGNEDATLLQVVDVGSGEVRYSIAATSAFAPNPDGTAIAISDLKSRIHLRDAQTGAILRTFQGGSPHFSTPAFSPDGALLAAAGSDARVTVWRVSDGRELVSFFGRAEREIASDAGANGAGEDPGAAPLDFLAVTPDGFYTGAKAAFRIVAFRMGARAYPFEQFDTLFNRPDVVLERLGLAPQSLVAAFRQARAQRLARHGVSEVIEAAALPLPSTRLTVSAPPAVVQAAALAVRIHAEDECLPIGRLHFTVNDIPFPDSAGLDLRARNARSVDQTVSLPLAPGRNKIQVWGVNSGGVESLRETMEVHRDAPAGKPKLWLLSVGVGKYKDAARNLTYPAKDAQDIAAFFESKASSFSGIEVRRLADEQATRKNVLNLRVWLRGARPEDQVVLFFAGHGLLDRARRYYFATPDIDFDAPAGRGLAFSDLESLLDGVQAHRKLLLVDSCHVGEQAAQDPLTTTAAPSATAAKLTGARGAEPLLAPRAVESGRRLLLEELFAELRNETGSSIIAAATGAALETDRLKNGVFTFALLEALRGNYGITVSRLREVVTARVWELTAGMQRPSSRRERLEFDFPVF